MRRLDRIRKAYGVDFYFCAKYRKFYEYMSSPHFRPSPREIVGSSPPFHGPDTDNHLGRKLPSIREEDTR